MIKSSSFAKLISLSLVGPALSGCADLLDGNGGSSESGDAGATASAADTTAADTTAADTAGTAGTAADTTGGSEAGTTGEGSNPADPAPWCDAPGECTCDGCPDSDVDTTDIPAGAETTWTFGGAVTGAVGNGEFFIEGPDGTSVGGIIPTDPETGEFQFVAPLFCGEQLVKCLWSNEAGTYVLVTRVITEDCVEPDIRVTLNWDELGYDFELHLVRPGGKINTSDDCTWTTCIGQGPDWGVQGDASDDPRKDIDDTGTFGPENIFLAGPEEGTYTVLVEHWGSGDPAASGSVTFNVAGKTSTVELSGLAPTHVWTAGTIEWPSGEVTPSQDVYDCSASWSGGCTADIP